MREDVRWLRAGMFFMAGMALAAWLSVLAERWHDQLRAR